MKHDKQRDKDANRIAVALYRDAVGEDFFAGDEGEELQVLRRIAASAPALLARVEQLEAALRRITNEQTGCQCSKADIARAALADKE